jgi:hypothetical protein
MLARPVTSCLALLGEPLLIRVSSQLIACCLRVRKGMPWHLFGAPSLDAGPSCHVVSCIVGGALAEPSSRVTSVQGRMDSGDIVVSATGEVVPKDQISGGMIDDVMGTTPPIRNHIVVCGPGTISVRTTAHKCPRTHWSCSRASCWGNRASLPAVFL